MYDRIGDMASTNGLVGKPVYANGNGNNAGSSGLYALAAGTAGYDQAVRIPNFNDGYLGAGPDVGAAEAGAGAMKFGVAASPGSSVSGSSNTSTTTPSTTTPTTTTPSTSTPTSGAISMSTSALSNFGTALTQTVTYTNKSSTKVVFMQATMSSTKYMQTNTCTVDILPGQSCTATITYYPQYGGTTSGTLTMTSSAPNSPHVVSLSADASATSTPTSSGKVDLSAASLSFTGTRTQKVTFYNNTGRKVQFIQASMSSARFTQTNNCDAVPAGGSCTATVTYTQSYTGS